MTTDFPSPNRRKFLERAGITAGFVGAPAILRGAEDQRMLKIGLVGAGGRGSGAALGALQADSNAELWSIAEVSSEQSEKALRGLTTKFGERINVPPSRRFIGLDAFQKVIDSGVDVVLLATPPGFRPQHLAAAVTAGKHIFCEKPVAVDVAGVKSVIESAKLAKEKGLTIISGFCWRYDFARRELYQRIHDGAIGDVLSAQATYLSGPVKPMPPADRRPAGRSDVAWQVDNWYNFSWLSGDSLVEQAVHSVDKLSWAFQDVSPVAAWGTGGRQLPAEDGNIFDHFHVTYEFPNQARGHLDSRQIPKCYGENSDYIFGTKGIALIVRGQVVIRGENNWRYSGPANDMYQEEQDTLMRKIRSGEPQNDGEWMARSTFLALLGRMACYTGERISWDQIQQSTEDLAPDTLNWDDTFKPSPLPMPGITKPI